MLFRNLRTFCCLQWKGQFSPASYYQYCIEPPYCTEYKHNSQSVTQISSLFVQLQFLLGVWNHMHSWTASHQLATILTDADDNFTRQVVDPGIALGPVKVYSTSRCRHSQRNWDAGRSTASSNHCFMVASFQEQLGSKLPRAARLQASCPLASWPNASSILVSRVKGLLSSIRLCLDSRDVSGILQWPKRTQIHPFPVEMQQQQRTATPATLIQKCNTGNENHLHIIRPMQYEPLYIANHTTNSCPQVIALCLGSSLFIETFAMLHNHLGLCPH